MIRLRLQQFLSTIQIFSIILYIHLLALSSDGNMIECRDFPNHR